MQNKIISFKWGNYIWFKWGNYVGEDKLTTYNFLFLCSLAHNGLPSIDDLIVSIAFLDVFIGVTIIMIKHHYPKYVGKKVFIWLIYPRAQSTGKPRKELKHKPGGRS